jgi:hypothetical protein
LNANAFPNFPVVAQVAFTSVPVFPFPDKSATVVPVPSSNPYAATNPLIVAVVVALAVLE